MASNSWSYQEARGKRRAYTHEKYVARLADLQHKTNWEHEELKQLQRHLEPLSLPERMEHLDILHLLPRNYVDYQPTNTKTRKRQRTSYEKELKISSNIEPWRFDVRLFMGNSHRVPAGEVHEEIFKLRAVNDGITALMIRDGWCKSTISLIRHALHVPGLHLAMLLCPPTTQNPLERDHARCTRTKCQALQVNRFTHTARHLYPECSRHCESIGADEATMDTTIFDGSDGIPRVVLPAFGIIPKRLNIATKGKFIAISHVWSHAFSYSPIQNAMPYCQLERLRSYLNQLMDGKAASHQIWMDAYCIPERASKGKAMSRIARTFMKADKIVILDAKLLQSSCKVSPFVQAIRILSSDWVRRLWTLEEAILGCANGHMNKLYFRFSDGYVILQTLLHQLRSTQCPYSHSAVLGLERHLTFRLVPDWRTWSPQHNSVAARFAQLARALEYRNTSKGSDELMCMASILGLPTKAILEADSPDDRAIAFYKTLKSVPASILFCNGTRISKRPFRWALASFISAEDPRKLRTLSKTTNHFGQVTPQGLCIRASAICFDFDPEDMIFDFNRIWIKPDRLALEPLGWGTPCQVPPWQSWSEIKTARRNKDQLTLMINPSCDHEGVVLRTLEKVGQVYHAEYLTQVHLRYAGKRASDEDEKPIWRPGSSLPPASSSASGTAEEDTDETEEEIANENALVPASWADSVNEWIVNDGSKGWERRSISARSRFQTAELQKWIIT